MKTAIFLGAGASAAEGAPIQSNLFRDYFKLVKARGEKYGAEHERELATLFQLMFDIDVDNGNLDRIHFPTFEEVLGVLDLANLRNESFKDFSNISFASNSGRIKFLRLYLVFLMADIINESLQKSKNVHRVLIADLEHSKKLTDVFFISTNYDILCDNAILDNYPNRNVNYGIDFINYREGTFLPPNNKSIPLYKLHGSLNWLYCTTCNNLRLTPNEKGVIRLMTDPTSAFCPHCETVYSPIIVPPTYYKEFTNVFLNQVWNRCETDLLTTEHVIFCGYSFPDADIHIKYLIKRIQKNRPRGAVKFTVINNHPGKSQTIKEEERSRFVRFLGAVDYTELSFGELASNFI